MTRIEVTGYASSDGPRGRNTELARRRADAVVECLRAQGFEAEVRARFDRREQNAIERELGLVRFRRVAIRPELIARPVAGAPARR